MIKSILVYLISFIYIINAAVDLDTAHWWIWIHDAPKKYNQYFTYNVGAEYVPSKKRIKYKYGPSKSKKITLQFDNALTTATWNQQLADDAFTHIQEYANIKVSIWRKNGRKWTQMDSVTKKVWIRPFEYTDTPQKKKETPRILFIGKKPSHTMHHEIYKWIDQKPFLINDIKYYNHGNVFTYIKSLSSEYILPGPNPLSVNRLDNYIKGWNGIVLFGHNTFALSDTPVVTETFSKFYTETKWWPIHVRNYQKHHHVEFLWSQKRSIFQPQIIPNNIPNNNNNKIKDALDLIPDYNPIYETDPDRIDDPPHINWQQDTYKGPLFQRTNKYGVHSYKDMDNGNRLRIFNSVHDGDRAAFYANKIKTRILSNPWRINYAFIEVDTRVAIKQYGGILDPTKKNSIDMYAEGYYAYNEPTIQEIILADMPNMQEFRNPLLFEPDGKGSGTGVVNKDFYHYMCTTMRNVWMAYSLNQVAKQQNNKRFFIAIGSKHGSTTSSGSARRYTFLRTYSLQQILMSDNVPLPFILKKSNQGLKIKYNFDPSIISPTDAVAKYKGQSAIIGDPMPGWYHANKYDEYNEYHDNNYYDYNITMSLVLFIILIIICGFIFGFCIGWISGVLNFQKSYVK